MIRLFGRSKIRAANALGVISLDAVEGKKLWRKPELEVLDAYFENRQYAGKYDWDIECDAHGNHLPLRLKKPRLQVSFAKSLCQRVAAKLVGTSVFPKFLIEDSPEDQAFLSAVIREAQLKSRIVEPVRRMLNSGSVLVRFYIAGGSYKVQYYLAKCCYPKFQENGDLESVEIKYTYPDYEDKDEKGQPKVKWYKVELGTESETLYDNPEYQHNVEPQFNPVSTIQHGLGFVQAEWMRTCEVPNDIDGYGLTQDLLAFIDELNYSLSQSSQAVSYNQDPQLIFKGMNEDELGDLVRSSMKSWHLGMQGEASFLETNLAGVERAIELRDKIRLNIQDISRIVLLDPEKVVGSAQSAKAMEVLHGPLTDLVDELRMPMEQSLKKLVLKMALATLIANDRGIPVPIIIPPGYRPLSLDVTVDWPPIFQQTMEDLQKKVQVASAAASANLISRATLTYWLAKDFNVEDIEAELQEIASQPVLNPFGGF
jgi:hypothetical protein